VIARKRRVVTNLTFTLVCSIVFSIFLFASNAGASLSPWNEWKNRCLVVLSETAGEDRINEPVEVSVKLSGAKADGSDIRVIDGAQTEVPYQIVEKGSDGTFTLAFFANVPKQSSKNYFILYNNPEAGDPGYDKSSSAVDNKARTWQTNDIFIQWGGKAGYYVDTKRPITALKFDDSGLGVPAKAVDRITDDKGDWGEDKSYGYLGSNISGPNPYGFGSETGSIVANGPVFSEFKLGSALIRSYKGKKSWIVTNGSVDSLFMFGRWYDREKHGSSPENIIKDNGLADVGPYPVYYASSQVGPGYMCFRQSVTGLVFGAIGIDTASWYIAAKESGGYDRLISFNNSSNIPNAKIYWYSDISNGYTKIESFSKQTLNSLKVEVVTDTEPPTTDIIVTPEEADGVNGWYVTQPKVKLLTDEDATIYYQLDDGDALKYAEPFTVGDGQHKLVYYAIDSFGNVEDEKLAAINVDTLPPITPSLLTPEDGALINILTPTYRWNPGSDIGSGLSRCELYVDDEVLVGNIDQAATDTVSPALSDGLHSWFLRVYDQAGNFINSPVFEFTVDSVPAETSASIYPATPDGNNGWYLKEPMLSLSTNETATILYSFDQAEYKAYESTMTIPEGIHKLYYYSVDLAGNKEMEKLLGINVDCSQPALDLKILPEHQDGFYLVNEPITFSYSATDSVSGIESVVAKVDGQVISNDQQLSFISPGAHRFEVIAEDRAGNKTSMIKEFNINISYEFKWLPPISKRCLQSKGITRINYRSTLPVKFAVFDADGNFVVDQSVKVVVSNDSNSKTFTSEAVGGEIKINAEDSQYKLNLYLKEFSWLKPDDKCAISVYFGGNNEQPGVAHGEIEFKLREYGARRQ